jgi:DnaJ-class molecular chaperone
MTNRYDPPSEPPEPSRRGPNGGRILHETCPDCDGSGCAYGDTNNHYGEDCEACHGTGLIETLDLFEE